jgi:hypothetical protein
MFLNLTFAFGHISPIIASEILNPALAYLPCSRALHVKCRLLPEDLIMSLRLTQISPDRLTFWRYNTVEIETGFSTNSLLLTLLCTAMEVAALLEMFKKRLVVLNANLEKLEKLC